MEYVQQEVSRPPHTTPYPDMRSELHETCTMVVKIVDPEDDETMHRTDVADSVACSGHRSLRAS